MKGTVDRVLSRGSGKLAVPRLIFQKSEFGGGVFMRAWPVFAGAAWVDGFLIASKRKYILPGSLCVCVFYCLHCNNLSANAPYVLVVHGNECLHSWHCSCVNPVDVGV